jgi:hypothetical protein
VEIKDYWINVFGPERQRRGIFIAFDHPNLASSGGAAYRHSYVAPPELGTNIIIEAIKIRLLRSRSETTDNNQLQFAHSAINYLLVN